MNAIQKLIEDYSYNYCGIWPTKGAWMREQLPQAAAHGIEEYVDWETMADDWEHGGSVEFHAASDGSGFHVFYFG